MKRSKTAVLMMISFLAMALLTSCGKKEIKLEPPTIKNEDIETGDNTEPEVKDDKTETESVKTDVPLMIVTNRIEGEDYTGDDDKEHPYAYVMYTEYVISDKMKEAYPELSRTLTKKNKDFEEDALNVLSEFDGYAKEAHKDGALYESFCMETKTEVVRADDRLFSSLDDSYDYAGGVHPNTAFNSLNIDVKTGKELTLNQVVNIGNADLCDMIVENLWPIFVEKDDEFEFTEEDYESMRDIIDGELQDGAVKFTLDDEALKCYFSPYEIQSYAVGPIRADLSLSEHKDLIKDEYICDGKDDHFEITYKEEAVRKIKEDELSKYGSSQGEDDEEYGKQYYIDNPDWDIYYLKDGIFDEMTKSPLTFKKVGEDKSDWLDEEAWAYKHGIELPTSLFSEGYGDGTYYYRADNRADEGIFCLTVSYDETDDEIATFDLTDFLDTPTGNEFTTPYIRYAKAYDDVLYIEIGHSTYAENQPYTSFIIAVDLFSGDLLWRSDMQVANGNNFIVGEDTIICGYGFTAEPDYIYVLSRKSGAVLDKIKVNSSPDYFIPEDDSLYVLCYNTAYEFNVTE